MQKNFDELYTENVKLETELRNKETEVMKNNLEIENLQLQSREVSRVKQEAMQ